jgi:hypothetical protein
MRKGGTMSDWLVPHGKRGRLWNLFGGHTNTEAKLVALLISRLGRRKREAETERLWVSQGRQTDFPIVVVEGLVTYTGGQTWVTDWHLDCRKMECPIDTSVLASKLSQQYPHRVVRID